MYVTEYSEELSAFFNVSASCCDLLATRTFFIFYDIDMTNLSIISRCSS